MGRRGKPADPAAIALRAARRRAEARERDKDPAHWGVSAEITQLPTAAGLEVRQAGSARRLHARRPDVFRHLLKSEAINAEQHDAAERYFEDRVAQLGVVDRDGLRLEVISGGGMADGVTQGMIDAGRRVARAETLMGRYNTAVLRSVMDRAVIGDVAVWRVWVQQATGETERHAQAAAMRGALQGLVMAYRDLDREDAARRKAMKAGGGSGGIGG